jgi:hypothetical protein
MLYADYCDGIENKCAVDGTPLKAFKDLDFARQIAWELAAQRAKVRYGTNSGWGA